MGGVFLVSCDTLMQPLTMVFVAEVQLDLPNSFPAAEFSEFMRWTRSRLLKPKQTAWGEFAGASNLIAWRFRGAFEGAERYRASWELRGSAVGFEELYDREHALFSMFTSAVACMEATSYAVHAILSDPRVLGVSFGAREQRDCTPAALLEVIKPLPLPDLETALTRIVGAAQWKRLMRLRNRMTHRSNLPRRVFGAVGALPPPAKAINFGPTSSTEEFEGEMSDLAELLEWLANATRSIMVACVSIP